MTITKSERNIASCVPARLVGSETDEKGAVKLLVPRFRAKWMQWLQKRLKKPYIRINLDEIGSEVWELIDGQKTVAEINTRMEEKFGERIQPSGERLGLFLGMLKRHKFVTWEHIEAMQEGNNS